MKNIKLLRIEKPDLKQVDPKKAVEKYLKYQEKNNRNIIAELSGEEYLYWDKIKYYPVPQELNVLELWYLIKQTRKFSAAQLPIRSENGKYFSYIKPGVFDEWLHLIDVETGGQMFTDHKTLTGQSKERFLHHGIVEEAIASSQLEGANTSRKAAKLMINQKRKPKTESEVMILNNYRAMTTLEQEYKNKKMSKELLFSLHKIVTDNDKELPAEERGRFRKDRDEIVVHKKMSNEIVHIPPKEKFLNEEMNKFVEFANDELESKFIHPVIKAILLHFWIGYLHPFTDGNGRVARAVFYWYLLRKNYWTIMYLPISTIIKKSPAQYGLSYINSEQDDNDVTYFLHYNLKKIVQAISEFHQYVERKISENRNIDQIEGLQQMDLNDRQKQLLIYLRQEGENAYTTAEIHRNIYVITRLTAYKDLHKLENAGVIFSIKKGNQKHYHLSKKYLQ